MSTVASNRASNRALASLPLLLALHGCGSAGSPAATAPHLGVQSNNGTSIVTLRMASDGPMTFATELHVSLESEMLGQPLTAELQTYGVRRVLEQRADGSLAMEEIDTSSHYAITMMGNTETGASPSTPGAPQRYVLYDRGRRVDELTTTATASGAPGRGDAVQERIESALAPLVRALEFPEQPLELGESWGSEGRLPLSQIDPSMTGSASYRMTQRLERFEGSGDARVAVISLEGAFDGAGATTGGRGVPTDSGLSGALQFRGFYAVAIADGFARTARVRFEGEARLGPDGVMRFPLHGEIRWEASPVDAR